MAEIEASMHANTTQFTDAFGNLYLQIRYALTNNQVRLPGSPETLQVCEQLCDANEEVYPQLQMRRNPTIADCTEQAVDRLFEMFDRREGFHARRNDLGHVASIMACTLERNHRTPIEIVHQSPVVLMVAEYCVWCLPWPDIHCFGLSKDGHPMHPMARGRSRMPDHAQPVLLKAGSAGGDAHGR